MESVLDILLNWNNEAHQNNIIYTKIQNSKFYSTLPKSYYLLFSKGSEYFSVFLHSKLSLERNAESRIQKALYAFCTCIKTFLDELYLLEGHKRIEIVLPFNNI